jgi:hypothetical protein
MNILWYSYIFFINFPLIKFQEIDTNTIQSTNLLELDNLIIKSPHVTILGALTNAEHIQILNNTSIYSNEEFSLSSQSFIINSNPLLTMSELCNIGNISHAKIILAGHPADDNDDDLSLSAIAYVSDFYHIPVLTIASRKNIFSDNVNIIQRYLIEKKCFFLDIV